MREINSVEDPERAALAGSEGGVEQAPKTAEEIGRERVEKTLEKFQSVGQKVSRAAKFLGRLGSKILFRTVAPVETVKEAWGVTSEAATKAYQYTSERVRGGAEKVASGAVDQWYNAVEKKNEIVNSVQDRIRGIGEQYQTVRQQRIDRINDVELRRRLQEEERGQAELMAVYAAKRESIEATRQMMEELGATMTQKEAYIREIQGQITSRQQQLGVNPEAVTA